VKRKIAIMFLIIIIGLFYCITNTDSAFAQTGNNRIGLSLESKAADTPQITRGSAYMSDFDFGNLIKQADALLTLNDFNKAYALLVPYEVYIFGSIDHWTNMARYDWRLCQIYERKCDIINLRFYLSCITETSLQAKPTKHQSQYIDVVDDNGVSTGKYYFGAASGHDLQILTWAREKLQILNQKMKPFGRPDPRMKYDGQLGRRYGRTCGF